MTPELIVPSLWTNDSVDCSIEFVKIATEYQGLDWMGTCIKGYYDSGKPPGTTLLPGDAPFSDTNVSNQSYTDGDPLEGSLMGFFGEGDALNDTVYALIVNLDYLANKTTTVTGPGELSIFDATTGLWTATGSDHVDLNLLPGGALVGLTSAVPEPSAIVSLVSVAIEMFCYV